jgi:flavin-dependent dehydrogenase
LGEARRAGVEVCEGSRVTGIRGGLRGGFTLTVQAENSLREVSARAVIGAQGKRSPLDAALDRQYLRRPHPYLALKAHFRGPPVAGRIEMFAFPGGYCGLSEIEGDRRNVCLLAGQPVFQRVTRGEAAPVEAFVRWLARQNEALGAWLRQAEPLQERWIAIAQVPFTPKPAVEKDILMAGDAAGLIAPLAGDGIAIALESGQLAGRHLVHFLAGEWQVEDLRRSYPAAWNRRYARRFRIGRLLQPLLVRPESARLAFRVLAALPRLGQYLISNTRGSSSPAVPSVDHFEELS